MSCILTPDKNTQSANGLTNATHAAATSGFLKDYGNYVGGTFVMDRAIYLFFIFNL